MLPVFALGASLYFGWWMGFFRGTFGFFRGAWYVAAAVIGRASSVVLAVAGLTLGEVWAEGIPLFLF